MTNLNYNTIDPSHNYNRKVLVRSTESAHQKPFLTHRQTFQALLIYLGGRLHFKRSSVNIIIFFLFITDKEAEIS
jgi:hypothetical protein